MSVRLYKKGNRYYAEWYDPDRRPKKKYTSLQTEDRDLAERKLKRLEIEFIDRKFDPWDRSIERRKQLRPLGNAIQRFLKTKSHLAVATQKNYSEKLGLLERYIGTNTTVDQITDGMLRDFLCDGNRRRTSQQSYLTHISAFFHWLVREEVIQKNPCKKVDLGKKPKVRVSKAIHEDELWAIIKNMEANAGENPRIPREKILLLSKLYQVMFYLGLRAREASYMKWWWVDWNCKTLRLPSNDEFSPKAKEEQKIRLVEPALLILYDRWTGMRRQDKDEYIFTTGRGKHIPPGYISKTFKKWVRRTLPEHRAKVVSLHSLRHGICLYLLKRTGNIEVAREHLRHSDISVTQVYARYTDEMYFDVLNEAIGA